MRKEPRPNIEKFRYTDGPLGSDSSLGCTGAFEIPGPSGGLLIIIASEGYGAIEWEHVSVSRIDRIPTWEEMDYVKRIFWKDDECVMQLHVPRKDWINNHPRCLHLWRPTKQDIPIPPSIAVGIKGLGVLAV